MPADLAAVQADDALIDMIGAGHIPGDVDDDLTQVLAAWRREVHAQPVPELVDTSAALAVIRAAARRRARRRNPLFGTAAAAAAVFVIAFSGVGLVAKSAQPGDHLWGVTQVLYSDYARSVETAAAVKTELNEANTALKQHDPERAKAALQRVQQQLPVVGQAEGHNELTARHSQLEQRLKTGSPDTDPADLPGTPPLPSSGSVGPKASEAPQPSGPPAPVGPTPTPELSKNRTPGTPTRDARQFMPDGPNPPRPYPTPGSTSPDSGVQDGRLPDTGSQSGIDGPGAGEGSHPTGATPSPSPTPDDSHVSGQGPGPGYVGPRPPGNGFGPMCERPSPRPPYCG